MLPTAYEEDQEARCTELHMCYRPRTVIGHVLLTASLKKEGRNSRTVKRNVFSHKSSQARDRRVPKGTKLNLPRKRKRERERERERARRTVNRNDEQLKQKMNKGPSKDQDPEY